MRNRLPTAAAVMAFAVLTALSGGKILSPYSHACTMPEWGYYCAAGFEAFLAIAILCRSVVAAWILVLTSVGAGVIALLQSGDYG
jgi:hypothetical protein